MRQPLAIYSRAARMQASAFAARVQRKLAKMAGKAPTKRERAAARPTVTIEEMNAGLDALGIESGDRIIVHSGISNVGKIKGGPAAVVAALRERVGPRGLLLLPVFPFGTLMESYLDGSPTFDAATSPTKMGAVTDVALKMDDRIRSVHPTHSVAGFGDEAAAFLAEHHLDGTPFGPHSPFWRLADAGGKILVMGVGLSSVTGFHLPEDRLGERFPVRVYTDKVYRIPCRDGAGNEVEVATRSHDPFISRIRDCYLMEAPLESAGLYRKYPLGNHYLGAIDFAGFDQLLQEAALTRRETIYGRV